jgi:hypothetical protein
MDYGHIRAHILYFSMNYGHICTHIMMDYGLHISPHIFLKPILMDYYTCGFTADPNIF